MAFKPYQMWLIFDGGKQKLRFPVLPDKITVNYDSENRSVDIAGLGEIFIKKDRPAVTVEFSCQFPAFQFPNLKVKKLQRPEALVKRIKKYKDSPKPSQLIVTQTSINMFCFIDKFKCEERWGDKGTIYYTIKFVEYRDVAVRRLEVNADGNAVVSSGNQYRSDTRVTPKTYTIKEGDDLYKIAKDMIGNGARWTELLKLNQNVVKGPSLLKAGTVLKLPDDAEVEAMEK